MDPVVHFEMPFTDKQRAVDFYAKAFGWKAQMLGPEMGEYVVVQTAETDPTTQTPLKPGSINGGLYPKPNDPMNQHPSVVIAVEDIDATLAKITTAGGQVIGEPADIPGVRRYASFFDTEGNRVSILKPLPMN